MASHWEVWKRITKDQERLYDAGPYTEKEAVRGAAYQTKISIYHYFAKEVEELEPLDIVDDRTPEQLKADGDDKWPNGEKYTPPIMDQGSEGSSVGFGMREYMSAARPDQPETSLDAHESNDAAVQRERIWEYMMSLGTHGAISDEVDAALEVGATIAASRRFSEMRRMGMIKHKFVRLLGTETQHVEKRKTRAGRDALVHVAVMREDWKPVTTYSHRAYLEEQEEQRTQQMNDLRLTLAAFVAAYGNCDVHGALMVIARKPDPIPGVSEHDALHVALFTVWLRACKVLGITLQPPNHAPKEGKR